MDTARYKAFLTSAETGSFSKAAEILCYTPSGVSQLVTALEKEFDMCLFHRSKKGVTLTACGQKLFPLIQHLLKQEQNIYQTVSELKGLQTGTVTIATYFSIAMYWLPKVIQKFQQHYNQIYVKLMEGTHKEIDSWLKSGQVDMAFMSYISPMKYDWISLAENAMVAVLPKNHILAKNKSYPLSYCHNDKFIMPEQGRDDDVMAMFQRNNITPNIYFSTVETFTTMPMIEQGLGISIMNELVTQRWEYDVVKLPLDPPQYITLGIAALDFKTLSPAASRFLKYAVTNLTQQQKSNI